MWRYNEHYAENVVALRYPGPKIENQTLHGVSEPRTGLGNTGGGGEASSVVWFNPQEIAACV